MLLLPHKLWKQTFFPVCVCMENFSFDSLWNVHSMSESWASRFWFTRTFRCTATEIFQKHVSDLWNFFFCVAAFIWDWNLLCMNARESPLSPGQYHELWCKFVVACWTSAVLSFWRGSNQSSQFLSVAVFFKRKI